MAIVDDKDDKVWCLCKLMPFRRSSSSSSVSAANWHNTCPRNQNSRSNSDGLSFPNVSAVARSFLPSRRHLKLDPANTLYFPYEPGKQVRSAIKIKNTSKSHVAFKFQTTSPKSCFMRPSGAILAPGKSIIATAMCVFKFVEHPENSEKPTEQKRNLKYKILSLKVKGNVDYSPELFNEQKDQVAQEQILRVTFLDSERPCPALEKLKRQLDEADAALEACKKPAEAGHSLIGEGLVVDEWKERRGRYLALQQSEGVDSV
nr:vesicle-associated protein 4-2-like [Ipomoea trifida]